MDFHNMRQMRRGLALFLAATAPVPALIALAASFAGPLADLPAVWLLGGAAAATLLYAAGLGWWLGGRIEGPLRQWADITEKVYMKQEFVEDLVFTNHKGALGKLARFAGISRD